MLSMRMLYFLKITPEYQIKMQILTLINQNFEKPSRNPSNRTKLKKKKKFYSSPQKFSAVYAQSEQKCSNIKILAKIEGK